MRGVGGGGGVKRTESSAGGVKSESVSENGNGNNVSRNNIKEDINGKSDEDIRRSQQYESLLAKANNTNLSDVESLGLIYHPGRNGLGHSALVFQSFTAPRKPTIQDQERYFLYAIRMMDPIVSGPYFVVYFHDEDVDLDLDWIKSLYDIWENKYVPFFFIFYSFIFDSFIFLI